MNVILLAGGYGKRLGSSIPKILQLINDKTILELLINKCKFINAKKISIVTNSSNYLAIRLFVDEHFKDIINNINFIIQQNPSGTGHAIIEMVRNNAINLKDYYLILSGDAPFISLKTLSLLMDTVIGYNSLDMVLVCTHKEDNENYERVIINDNTCRINKIVKDVDCNNEEKKIKLINCGIYVIYGDHLIKYSSKLTNDNKRNEYCITEFVKLLYEDDLIITSQIMYNAPEYEFLNINTKEQLLYAQTICNK